MKESVYIFGVAAAVAGVFVAGLVLNQPRDQFHIDTDGVMSIEQFRWLGFSSETFPLELRGVQWQIQRRGEWVDYEFPKERE